MTQADVLLFVPAVVQSENQTALRIAQLLAQSASKTRHGTYTVESSPTSTRSTILDPAGNKVLHIVQVEYHGALFGAKPPTNAKLRDAWRALYFALFATYRLLGSVRRSRSRRPKAGNAKWQIAVACLLVGALWLGFGFLLVLVLDLVLGDKLPASLTDSAAGQSAAAAGGVAGLLALFYWRIRDPVMDLGRRLQAVMGYAERQDAMLRVTAVVDEALDAVIEEYPHARIHLFGFSFGSIALLDALFPSKHREVERRELAHVATVTTVGCPADFLRLLYSDHYQDRVTRLVGDTRWTNLYIPADVLGSNFLEGRSDAAREPNPDKKIEPAPIASVMPHVNIPVGRQKIEKRRMLFMDGFAVHGKYWALNEPRHLESLVGAWLPPAPSSPPPAPE